MEKFYLMNGEIRVASFVHDRTLIGDVYSNIEIFNEKQLPMRLKKICTHESLENWINRRTVPVNRHHMEAMLGALNLEKSFDLMRYSHALSLNDTFWIQEESENLKFKNINLYENKFDEALGWIAFTGLPSDISRNLSTPELTTVGVLPKFWQRIGINDVILCKGGTSGYSNAGYEQYHEVVSNIVAKVLNINVIPYKLEFRNKKIVSVSKLFTTKKIGLITANEYIDYKSSIAGFKSLVTTIDFMKKDNIELYPFYAMCFFDYIIENFDRHLNNWGFSVDNKSQKIIGLAPIWDNGASLDYDKPKDMRVHFDFASFNVKYDFVKACEFTQDFIKKTNKLLTYIKSGKLFDEIYNEVKEYYSSEDLTKKTVSFIEERCNEFLKPLPDIKNMKSF